MKTDYRYVAVSTDPSRTFIRFESIRTWLNGTDFWIEYRDIDTDDRYSCHLDAFLARVVPMNI